MPIEYHRVSEISKHCNFKSEINYELKQKIWNNKKLTEKKNIIKCIYIYNIP